MPTSIWTFRLLLARTFSLLRENPVFVVPVVVADLISFAAMHIQHALHEPLFNWLLAGKGSVLDKGHSTFVLTYENASKAALLVAPLLWGCCFLTIYVYATALLSISNLLKIAKKGEKPNLRLAVKVAIKKQHALFRVSIMLFGLIVIAALLMGGLFRIIVALPSLDRMMGVDMSYLVSFLVEIPVVYFSTSPALQLLRDPGTVFSPGVKRLAVIWGMATVAVQLAYTLLTQHAAPASFFQQTTISGLLLREIIQSQIAALTYVPFFIALSLLVSPTDEYLAVSEITSDLEPAI